jgi:hypothetical protein
VDNSHLCELCQWAFEPKEVKPGVRILQKFKGYTVDVRLHEFRKVNSKPMQFIAFASPKGQKLLAQMHADALQQARNNLADLEKQLQSSWERNFSKGQKQEEVTR